MAQQRTDIDLEEFRQLLLAEHARLTALHTEQRRDMLDEADDANNELTSYHMDEHAETATILYDMEREAVQDENIKDELRQIERALDRIEEGTYGLDEVTGEPIPIERLRALPMATLTVESAERFA